MVNDFIFELGCEELPSGAVWPLANQLADNLLEALDKAQLRYTSVKRFATPRRLAVTIYDLQTKQGSQLITKRGPAAVAAYDSAGKPTQALLGFAKSCGVELDKLSRIKTDKGDWIIYETEQPGQETKDLLPVLVNQAVSSLSLVKPMRWGDEDIEFARPVHWIVMLYGDEVLQHPILGVNAGRYSRGHRFHAPQEFLISSAKAYEKQLRDAFVIADFSLRRQTIQDQVQELVVPLKATAVIPDELLDEVTSIVEWPQALVAHFAEEFLDVPAEALIASMQSHQKCFALKNAEGQLIPYFITVANIASNEPDQVILGNEKVMRARLSDAAFFFQQDKKNPLEQHLEATKQVVFQEKLGSLYDKAQRVAELMVDLSTLLDLPKDQARRVALLSKCDLLSGMVGEFPELQGLMGYYYALHDGEEPASAQALNEQYMPRFAADDLPQSVLGTALSLADRIDTLVGIFALGLKPSGVKDPFKLRRHALAVVRLLQSLPIKVELSALINKSFSIYSAQLVLDKEALLELKPFILERLNSHYQAQNISSDLVLAVRARQDEWLYDLDRRVQALRVFMSLPEAGALIAASKRVSNILGQIDQALVPGLNVSLLVHEAEKELYKQISQLDKSVTSLYNSGDYEHLLQQLSTLKEAVDSFFDEVMVMVDDIAIKENRLALLTHLKALMQGVADIALLQV
jgi:glycyl-tRNA synthetase beta chain